MTTYIVRDCRPDTRVDYVAAPPGYYWTEAGVKREPIGFRSVGPEHTDKQERAYRFRSHRSAARVANLCPGSEILEA